jgi:transposase-like protein
MAEERRKYNKEFKLTAVELSLLRGKAKELAKEYGIDPQMRPSW